MRLKYLLELLRNPLFFLVRGQWIERNEPLIIVDVTTDLKSTLKRPGNENAEYVLIGFKVPK
jgi:hypothetical protein